MMIIVTFYRGYCSSRAFCMIFLYLVVFLLLLLLCISFIIFVLLVYVFFSDGTQESFFRFNYFHQPHSVTQTFSRLCKMMFTVYLPENNRVMDRNHSKILFSMTSTRLCCTDTNVYIVLQSNNFFNKLQTNLFF